MRVPCNEHPLERLGRGALGVVLLGFAVGGASAWGWLGVIPLATAVTGFCPLYSLLGINTCPVGQR